MNTADYIRHQFEFLYTSNARLLRAAAGLSEEEYARENGFSYKSLRGILTHALDAEVLFMSRLTDGLNPEVITEADVPTIEALRARWDEVEKAGRAYLEKLSDADLETPVSFIRRDGSPGTFPPWQLLSMVYQHTLQHRSEAAEALSLIGRSPGSMDFSFYLASLAAK